MSCTKSLICISLKRSHRATTRTLQSTEAAHKHTTAELQRTRTALQAIRATHATELKKLDKEKERALDRWNKLTDSQLKLGGSRFTCSNLEVIEASDVQLRGKGKGFLEVSAEQAEQARNELFNENGRLRGTILSAANEMQRLLHNARCLAASETREEVCIIFVYGVLWVLCITTNCLAASTYQYCYTFPNLPTRCCEWESKIVIGQYQRSDRTPSTT